MGSAGVDYLASIASFPEPDAKLRTDAFEVQGGGNAGNALTAMARLGVRAAILTKLSDDGAGKAILDEFAGDGVDTSAVVVEPGKSSPFTYIIVDRAGSTRTCIHTPGPEFKVEEMPRDAIAKLVEGASLVYFDGRLTEVALEVAAVAQAMGVPLLVEGERLRDNLDKLLLMADVVVTSTGYPAAATAEATLETAMVKMAASHPRAKALITTLGSRGAVMVQRVDDPTEVTDARRDTLAAVLAALEAKAAEAAPAKHVESISDDVPMPNEPVTSDVVFLTDAGDDDAEALGPVRVTFAPAAAMAKEAVADTTGAGDSFIGSVAYGMAAKMELAKAMRLGAYVAARKCTQLGARPGLPRRDVVPAELLE